MYDSASLLTLLSSPAPVYMNRETEAFFVEILFFSQIKLWQTCFCFVANSHAHKAFLNRETERVRKFL